MWPAVIGLILFFTFFAVFFLKPKKKREWRSFGLFEAFLVALYAEMYGFPLTIYILSSVLGVHLSLGHKAGHLNAVILERLGIMSLNDAWRLVMAISSILIWSGLVILGMGWRRIYRGKEGLVTEGVYSYIRHPQYLGLMLILIGMLIQWPTILTAAMFPFLFIAYRRLAGREERELAEKFGETYREYERLVPSRFIPMHLLREKRTSKIINHR
ncbi:MAG: isoprenylcysteine carboxylmethyltransferase family protein [Nitrospirae bacterium]|nr:isoprenylcysteine carboxylmethyltransferase family protein [Nitrospirota bacterium]